MQRIVYFSPIWTSLYQISANNSGSKMHRKAGSSAVGVVSNFFYYFYKHYLLCQLHPQRRGIQQHRLFVVTLIATIAWKFFLFAHLSFLNKYFCSDDDIYSISAMSFLMPFIGSRTVSYILCTYISLWPCGAESCHLNFFPLILLILYILKFFSKIGRFFPENDGGCYVVANLPRANFYHH